MNISKIKELTTTALSIIAILGFMFGVVSYVAKPHIKPFLDIPNRLETIENTIEDVTNPEILDFKGSGIIVNKKDSYKAGESFTVFYLLRREASCDTNITVRFYNTKKGVYTTSNSIAATKSPVSEFFTNFRLQIVIPDDIEDGEYTYHPIIHPIDCGVYKEFTPPHTEKFEVRNG